MHMKVSLRTAAMLSLLAALPVAAHGQSAAEYNRAAQAIQLCSSSMGALVPECANLRGALSGGMAPSAVLNPYVATGGGKSSAVAAGLLGMATQALSAARAAPAAPAAAATDSYTATALAAQNATQAYHACVMRVGATNAAGVQGCIAQLQAASGAAPAVPAGFPGQATVGFPGQGTTTPLAAAAASAFSALIGR